MARKTIPEKTIITCDVCDVICEGINYKIKGNICFNGNALDIYGNPAAPADFKIDMCDKCAKEFYNKYHPSKKD